MIRQRYPNSLIKYGLALLLTALGSVLSLPACGAMGASTPAATVTAQPSEPAATASPSPTLTETPSLTPTVTPMAGPSPTPVPTPVFGSARVGDNFLFGNQPEGCELPCWQGLMVGKSNVEDVQKMYGSAFALRDMVEFHTVDHAVTSDASELLSLSHQWILWENGVIDADLFFVSTLFQKDRGILRVIRLVGDGDQFKPYSSPQYILRNMGLPSQILLSAYLEQTSDWYDSELLISYDDGVTVYYPSFLARAVQQNRESNEYTIELCLDNLPGSYGSYIAEVYVTHPHIGDTAGTLLSPLRYGGTQTDKMDAQFKPLEEVFDLSLEEVTELAKNENNACIYAPMP